jgi:arsenate reductase
VKGDETVVAAAFHSTLARIETRCRAFLALPFAQLDRDALKRELDRISTL